MVGLKYPPAAFTTLVEALLAAPPNRTFVTMWHDEDCNESVTFGEFVHLATSQAAVCHARGVAQGDTIVIVMPQGIPLMATFVGAMLLGAVPTILAYPNFKVDPDKVRLWPGRRLAESEGTPCGRRRGVSRSTARPFGR